MTGAPSPRGLAPVAVVVADDHPAMRAGIREALVAVPRVRVVGEAATGPEALALVRALVPDVVVLDLDLPGLTGVDVARALREEGSPVRVVAFTAHAGRAFVEGLVEAGVAGYVTKDKDLAVLVEAVEAVARGEGRWFVVPTPPDRSLHPLSARERAVLGALAAGLSNEAIAERLSIAPSTVRNHLSRIYEVLGVSTAREAIVWAWERGLGGGGPGRDR